MLDDISHQLKLFGEPEPLRREHDFYATPFKCVEALKPVLDELFMMDADTWLEPCAGDGAIIRHCTKVLRGRPAISWEAYEIRDTEIYAPGASIEHLRTNTDFLSYPQLGKYSVALTNPPFKLWEQFLLKCWPVCDDILFLLPLSALGGLDRKELYREFPLAGLYPLSFRPSFTADGGTDRMVYAWFHWMTVRPIFGNIAFQVL